LGQEAKKLKKNNCMKKKILYFSMLLFVAMFNAACDKRSDGGSGSDSSIPDHEGTVMVSMKHGERVSIIGGEMIIDSSDNFRTYYHSYYDFVSVGKVKGLGEVTKIPTNGWSKQIAVVPGNGYVVRNNNNNYNPYARLYVVDYITNTYNEIIGANVKYQCPFEP
jgi:hypothetical protein